MSNLKVVTLDGVTSTAGVAELKIRRVERDALGEDRTERVEVPGRAGAWTFPESPGTRRIRLIGWLQAEGVAAKRTAIHNLSEWIAAAQDAEVQLIVSDESDRFYDVTVKDWDVDTAERHPTVVIEFVGSAYALATALSTHTENASGSPDSGTFNVTDDFAADPVIEITPTNGTLTGFTLTLNGDTVEWIGGLIGDDDTITISSLSDTVTLGANDDMELTGVFDPLDVSMAAVSVSGFPSLVPGSNSWALTWTGTATTVDVDFTWRERFI
jgi:phage-related protein